jgi:hypothetical protein
MAEIFLKVLRPQRAAINRRWVPRRGWKPVIYPPPGHGSPPKIMGGLVPCDRGYHLATPRSLPHWYNWARDNLSPDQRPVIWLVRPPRHDAQRVWMCRGTDTEKMVVRTVHLLRRLEIRTSRQWGDTSRFVIVPGHGRVEIW